MIEDYVKANMPSVDILRNDTYMTFLDFSQTMASIGADEQYESVSEPQSTMRLDGA